MTRRGADIGPSLRQRLRRLGGHLTLPKILCLPQPVVSSITGHLSDNRRPEPRSGLEKLFGKTAFSIHPAVLKQSPPASVGEKAMRDLQAVDDLELRIESLRAAISRNNKFKDVGKIAGTVGVCWLAGMLARVFNGTGIGLLAGITLGIGGVVLAGSSKGTTDRLVCSLIETEATLNRLVDELPMRELPQDTI